MIRKLWLKNFGPYENAEISLDDFTIVLGPNGAGKSLLFVALRALGRIAKFPLRYSPNSHQPGGYPTRTGQVSFDDIVHRREATRTIKLGVRFESKEIEGEYEVEVGHWQNAGGILVAERLDANGPSGRLKVDCSASGGVTSTLGFPTQRLRTPRFNSVPVMLFNSRDPKESELGRVIQEVLMDRVGIYRFDPTALKTPSEVGKSLSATGYGFASYLDEIRNEPGGKQEFEALLGRFRLACPHVEDVLLPSDERSREGASPRKRIALVMPSSSPPIPADLESDGTILLLAYAALLHGSRAHSVLCVEEPENGIHPKAIPAQVKMLQALTKSYGDREGAQILICTHSRPFFDEVKKDHQRLRLVRRGSDGRSTIEAPSFEQLGSIAAWAGLA